MFRFCSIFTIGESVEHSREQVITLIQSKYGIERTNPADINWYKLVNLYLYILRF